MAILAGSNSRSDRTTSVHPHADTAVVLAAHGDRAGERPNATLLGHCVALAELGVFGSVHAGFLKAEPDIEQAIAHARGWGAARLVVVPIFMADGYFVRRILEPRVRAAAGSANYRILAPLGLDPRLADLMCHEAEACALAHDLDPRACRLLIVGHGSEIGPASARATRRAGAVIAKLGRFAVVATAFLEEPEFLADALKSSPQPTIVSGFFSGDGLHAGEDVPTAITDTAADAIYAGSIGRAVAVRTLILSAIDDALGDWHDMMT